MKDRLFARTALGKHGLKRKTYSEEKVVLFFLYTSSFISPSLNLPLHLSRITSNKEGNVNHSHPSLTHSLILLFQKLLLFIFIVIFVFQILFISPTFSFLSISSSTPHSFLFSLSHSHPSESKKTFFFPPSRSGSLSSCAGSPPRILMDFR